MALARGTAICAGLILVLAMRGWAGEESGGLSDDLTAEVSAERFRAHMSVLAVDTMAGRETGTEGYLAAARYVASQFAEFGLTPRGDQGSYFQSVPLLATKLVPGSTYFAVSRRGGELVLAFPNEYVMSGSFGGAEESITAPLVFVGYGIEAPQHGHHDFAGAGVEGKILVRLTGAPARFPADERAFYSSSWVKNELAVERGAVGVITMRSPADLPRLPWQRYLSAIGSSDMRWTGPDGTPFEAFPQLAVEAVLSEGGAARLFEFAGRDPESLFAYHEAGHTGSFEFGLSASMRRRSSTQRLSAPNVVAVVPGSDPRLRDEYLLYTAHLDHLGVRPGEGGDDIHNGAYDNAAGVATILEVARILAARTDRPRRSVLFAALTGEEKGLLGSSYLAENPPVSIENIVGVVNIDMPYLGFPIAEIMGLGVEHSSLQAALERAAEDTGIRYISDPRPDLVRFIRSDQFSFVRRAIPGLNLKPGARSSDPAVDGGALHEEYLQRHYHYPSDDLGLPFSPPGAERFTRVALLLGLAVVDADQRPAWNRGDFFGQRFGAGEPRP